MLEDVVDDLELLPLYVLVTHNQTPFILFFCEKQVANVLTHTHHRTLIFRLLA